VSTPGLLVMAHGTPASLDEIEPFYTRIRRGRPPSPELLEELVGRYEAIGGTSPLRERTEAQRDAIAAALPPGWRVALGQKMVAPFVETGLAELATAGCDTVVGLVLAPHASTSSAEYHERAAAAAAERGVAYRRIDGWHLLPAYVAFLRAAVASARTLLTEPVRLLCTAHSLPQRVADAGDPYPRLVAETAAAVDPAAEVAWQSAGRTPEPWLGPDVLAVIRGTAPGTSVLVCACGFVADHLEVLYDLDVEAKRIADEHAVGFGRTASLNDEPAVMAALARLVEEAAAG
jgi:ferrochelatase